MWRYANSKFQSCGTRADCISLRYTRVSLYLCIENTLHYFTIRMCVCVFFLANRSYFQLYLVLKIFGRMLAYDIVIWRFIDLNIIRKVLYSFYNSVIEYESNWCVRLQVYADRWYCHVKSVLWWMRYECDLFESNTIHLRRTYSVQRYFSCKIHILFSQIFRGIYVCDQICALYLAMDRKH